jgi:hypothetical protein
MAYLLSLILFYQNYTGQPYHLLIEQEWGRDTTGCWIQPQHRVQWGDLNTDGTVGPGDLACYFGATGVYIGWGTTDIGHLYKDCWYIAGKDCHIKTVKRICLPCWARSINEQQK